MGNNIKGYKDTEKVIEFENKYERFHFSQAKVLSGNDFVRFNGNFSVRSRYSDQATPNTIAVKTGNTESRFSQFALNLIPPVIIDGDEVDPGVWELDICEFKKGNEKFYGYIEYSKKMFAYIVKRFDNNKVDFLGNLEIVKVLGNIYTHSMNGGMLNEITTPLSCNGTPKNSSDNNNSSVKMQAVERSENMTSKTVTTNSKPRLPITIITNYVHNEGSLKSGWGFIIRQGEKEKKYAGVFAKNEITLNECKLSVILKSFHKIGTPSDIVLYVDDKTIAHVINSDMLQEFRKNDWKKEDGTIVQNKEYWAEILKYICFHKSIVVKSNKKLAETKELALEISKKLL